MGASENGVNTKSEGLHPSTAAAPRILAECRFRTVTYTAGLPGLLGEVLDKELAERTATVFSQPDGNRRLECLRLIEKNKTRLGELFQTGFIRYFDQKLQDGEPVSRPGIEAGGGFSLVDDRELEESLAVSTLTGKLRERFGDDLFGLSERYQELLPGQPMDVHRLPMGPDGFCHAMRDATAVLDLDADVRVQCYKLFERVLLQGGGDFYAGLNSYLVEQGVLPQLKARIRSQPAAPSREGKASAHATAGGRAGGGGSGRAAVPQESASMADEGFFGEMVAPVQEPMFQAMHYLLGGQVDAPTESLAVTGQAAGGIFLPVTPLLIDTLSSLQHDNGLIERSGELLRGGLKQHVVGRFETMDSLGRPGAINQIDDETIDVISMIFDYILDDRMLPDFIKALIGRLQIPVLKVAIVDRKFFNDKSHPVRQLLNELAYAGVGLGEESEAARDRLYEKMESTVRRVLDEFDHDVGIFTTLLEDFRGFLEEEKKIFALAQERIGIAAEENGQIERLKVAVAEELAARLAGRTVPGEVREFLLTCWRQWITQLQINGGEASPSRVRALQVMDDLLWSLEPKTSSEQRRRLGVLLPILLEELREAQLRIGRSEEEIAAFAAILERHHFNSLKVRRTKEEGHAAAEASVPPASASPEGESPPAKEPGQARLDEIDRMFQEISGDIESLPELDTKSLFDFDELVARKEPDHQGSFEKMMAEMGLETESDAGPRVEDAHTARVRALELGTWVELAEPDDRRLRVKLAWVGDAYTNYSFVNRQYKVVAERPLYVLAEEFRSGSARVIEDVALFDRALDGVISGIMKFARPRASAGHA